MRQQLTTAVALLAASLGVVSLAENVYDNGVLVLDDHNFEEAVAQNDYLLVQFYAPWCVNCAVLEPEYAEAAKILAKQDPPRVLAKVNAEEYELLANKYELTGYPSLFFFENGTPTRVLQALHTSSMIVDWVNRQSVSNSTPLVSCEEMSNAAQAEDGLAVIYNGPTSGKLYESHVAASFNHLQFSETWKFIHSDDRECAQELGLPYPGVSLLRFFDKNHYQVKGGAQGEPEPSQADIEEALRMRTLPELIMFNDSFIADVMFKKKSSLVLFTGDVNKDGTKSYFQEFTKASESYFNANLAVRDMKETDKLLFVTSGVNFGIQIKLGDYVGVYDGDELPQLYIITPQDQGKQALKYKYTQGDVADIQVEDIENFIKSFKNGDLPRFYKSQPLPEQVTSPNKVHTVVGYNWDAEVKDPAKDVFVAFGSPYCYPCKELDLVWDTLAAASPEDVILAQVDGNANELDGVERPFGYFPYPYLIFYPKGNKEGMVMYEYEAEYTEAALWDWLRESSESCHEHMPELIAVDDADEVKKPTQTDEL